MPEPARVNPGRRVPLRNLVGRYEPPVQFDVSVAGEWGHGCAYYGLPGAWDPWKAGTGRLGNARAKVCASENGAGAVEPSWKLAPIGLMPRGRALLPA